MCLCGISSGSLPGSWEPVTPNLKTRLRCITKGPWNCLLPNHSLHQITMQGTMDNIISYGTAFTCHFYSFAGTSPTQSAPVSNLPGLVKTFLQTNCRILTAWASVHYSSHYLNCELPGMTIWTRKTLLKSSGTKDNILDVIYANWFKDTKDFKWDITKQN